jgi:hypothetical protein
MPCNGDCNQGRECNCECKKETVTKQHKWHKEIKAWAMGCQIEEFACGVWEERDQPKWSLNYQYRIKPQPKQPKYLYAYIFNGAAMLTETHSEAANGGRYIGKIEVQDD